MLSGDARANALMATIEANNPKCGELSAGEKQTFLTALKAIVGTDTSYLVGNTVVRPTAFAVPAGIGVQVAVLSGSGATVAPGSVSGTGTIA